jgi:membrane-associated phospholipid phosphatase
VAAQAMQDTLRGDEAAPWVWAIGLTLATGVGYLRVGADAHWLTDVLAGAAVGTAIGVAVPLFEKRLVKGVTIAPAPGGFAIRF